MSSTRTKVLAADGQFDVRATSPGTEVTVCIPLHPAELERPPKSWQRSSDHREPNAVL